MLSSNYRIPHRVQMQLLEAIPCYISKNLVADKNLNAGNIVRELGKYIQGGGGGQPFFATAGGKNPDGISEALEEGKKYIQNGGG